MHSVGITRTTPISDMLIVGVGTYSLEVAGDMPMYADVIIVFISTSGTFISEMGEVIVSVIISVP